MLNSNIRCIEIRDNAVSEAAQLQLNSNIRCIEMRNNIEHYKER